MNVWILPISGGQFVNQCASIISLLENENKPDIMFGSSGGNLTAYITMAGDWTPNGIIRLCENISSSLIFKSWSNLDVIGFLKGFFSGNLYKNGPGIYTFIKKYFTEKTIKDVEIWTGCFDKEENKSKFFCNRNKKDCYIQIKNEINNIYQYLEPVYANGNIELISDYIVASASVPVIVNEKKVLCKKYVDGGLGGASPFTHLYPILYDKIEKEKKSLHLTYINCMNLDSKPNNEGFNLIGNWKNITACLTRQLIVQERAKAYDFLGNNVKYYQLDLTKENLENIDFVKTLIEKSLLEIYPKNDNTINYQEFIGKDVIEGINSCFGQLGIRFWWKSCKNNKKIYNILN